MFESLSYDLIIKILNLLSPLNQRSMRIVSSLFNFPCLERHEMYKIRMKKNTKILSTHVTVSGDSTLINLHTKSYYNKQTMWESYELPSDVCLRQSYLNHSRAVFRKVFVSKFPETIKATACCEHHGWKALLVFNKKTARSIVIAENFSAKIIEYLIPMSNNVGIKWLKTQTPTLIIYDIDPIEGTILRAYQYNNAKFSMIDTKFSYYNIQVFDTNVVAKFNYTYFLLTIHNKEWKENILELKGQHKVYLTTNTKVFFSSFDEQIEKFQSMNIHTMTTSMLKKKSVYVEDNGEEIFMTSNMIIHRHKNSAYCMWKSSSTMRMENFIFLQNGTCVFNSKKNVSVFLPFVIYNTKMHYSNDGQL